MLVGGGPSTAMAIMNNLVQIDIAKRSWALDHNITNAVQITEQDLAGYLPRRRGSNELVIPVVGEQYSVKPLGTPPEARLTRAFGNFPKGTVIRLGTDGHGYETIPPNLAGQRMGVSRSTEETNRTSSAAGSRR